MKNEKIYLLTFNGTLEGQSGEHCGGEYSLNGACPTCGTRAELIGNLPVKKVKGNKAFIETLSGDYLIVSEVYHNLKLLSAKVGELLPVIDYKTKQKLPYYHFKTDFYFPKMLHESEGIITEDQCPTCKQDGYFDDHIIGARRIVRKYRYNYSDVQDLLRKCDIFHTWEHFGKSNLIPSGFKVVRYARPRLLVKENIKKALEDINIKKILFEEVLFPN